MKNWDKVYSKKFGGTWYPNEGCVRFTARYIRRRIGINTYDLKKKVKRILDLGCGNGRHIVFFAEQGFDVYGIDISREAVEIARGWLIKKRLKADLRIGDIKKLPYKDKYFDLVVSFGTLDHVLFTKAKEVMKEIKRVLLPGGYFFVSLRSTESSECGRGKLVDKNTFVLQEGYEKGLIQHFFNLSEVKELLKGFRIFDIELYEEKFPSIYTIDKSFLQSFGGMKKYINFEKLIDLDLKESRWYIAAEKI